MNGKGLLWQLHCFPLFAPNILPQSPSPSPPRPPNHGKRPNLVLRRSGGPHTPPDLPSAPWNPQLPTHHFTRAASATGLSTAPDLLDRHHGPPHRICLTGALVHPSVGPSLTPSSAPSLALHIIPCLTQQIRLTERTIQHARRSLRPLHRTRSTDAILNSTGPASLTPQPHQGYFNLYSLGFSLLDRATVHLPQMSFLVCRQAPQP